MTASSRNWDRMFFSVAPRAFLRPISCVRSVTDTSMMFMMPMPPTTSEMAATETRNMVSTESMVPTISIASAWVSTKKSSLSGSVMPWLSRRVASMSATVTSTFSSLSASTAKRWKYLMPNMYCWAVV